MHISHTWKKIRRLSEEVASLDIMGPQLMSALSPLNTIVLRCTKGFQGELSITPPWCRETLVSRTAVRPMVVIFPICHVRNKNYEFIFYLVFLIEFVQLWWHFWKFPIELRSTSRKKHAMMMMIKECLYVYRQSIERIYQELKSLWISIHV